MDRACRRTCFAARIGLPGTADRRSRPSVSRICQRNMACSLCWSSGSRRSLAGKGGRRSRQRPVRTLLRGRVDTMWPASASTCPHRSVHTRGSSRRSPPGMGSTRAGMVWPRTSSKCPAGMVCILEGTLRMDSRGTCGTGRASIDLSLEARTSQGGRTDTRWPLRWIWSRSDRFGTR